ncbi:hypothetical protein PL9631_900093 [Planktothrix paucivesiculata PCC 9631]|uniref:Uncharacterized protein n=1 Tax=Planktothrix paucivesiculata PCC 9631 TaxID=671071 RepID=A0A7Z9C3P2_9CYAN|nr:hypothetical protein PL9631_900093 [Planktothrix paucivesiculata PCC 9631]
MGSANGYHRFDSRGTADVSWVQFFATHGLDTDYLRHSGFFQFSNGVDLLSKSATVKTKKFFLRGTIGNQKREVSTGKSRSGKTVKNNG